MDQVAPNTWDLAFRAGLVHSGQGHSGLGDQEHSVLVAPREWADEAKADPNLPIMAVSVPEAGADLVKPKLLVPKVSAPVDQEDSVLAKQEDLVLADQEDLVLENQEDLVLADQEDLVLADRGVSAPAFRAVQVVPKA